MRLIKSIFLSTIGAAVASTLSLGSVFADNLPDSCPVDFDTLKAALDFVSPDDTGLKHNMWATVVNRDGIVCAVAMSGENRGDQWPGSRVISAQKANTANSFSLSNNSPAGALVPGLALSTANLWAPTQPGGSLFGLQFSNPVDSAVAYGDSDHDDDDVEDYGTKDDPLVGHIVGGVNVFGGGLALYAEGGVIVGALGLSGDTSCSDHIQAWKVRDGLPNLDNVPAGVSPTGDDNIIFDLVNTPRNHPSIVSAGAFGHPECGFGERRPAENLPRSHPIGPN